MKIKRVEVDIMSSDNMWAAFEVDGLIFTVCKESRPPRKDATYWGRVSKEGEWNSQGVWATTMRELFSGLRGRLGERKSRVFSGLDADVKT